ncbi:MAG TPA: hypothetical protein VF549_15190 [Solirubrobacteraceae bacterium]|jgi:hypothetical protein
MRRLLTSLRRRQEGIALPVAIGTMTITMGLAAATFAVVIEGSHSSVRDRDSKAALAAAEAGLQMAILKTTDLKPLAGQCVTNSLVAVGSDSNDGSTTAPTECPRYKASIGNGASYTYVVATTTSGTCPTVPGFVATAGKDRCITVTGEANGVKRRIQVRFYFNPPFIPWGNAGLVSDKDVDFGNNAEIRSPVGTNGNVYASNNTQIIGPLLLPPNSKAYFDNGAGSTEGIKTPRVGKWIFPEIDWSDPRANNENSWLTANNVPGWDAAKQSLTLYNTQQITLPGGTYHLCALTSANSNWLNVPNGQVVRLFIDSPRDPASGCSATTPNAGRMVITNSAMVNATDDKNPAELEIYAYGTTADASEVAPDIDINNGVEFYGTIWAPHSTISVKNNEGIAGGFTGGAIDLKNNGGFFYDPRVANKALPGTASARNLSWFECKRDPTVATDPESGC